MGCDYYIIKLLRIYYNDSGNDYLEIEIDREKGYFNDCQFDEDADDFEDKLNDHIKEVLTPKVEPIVIYRNNRFNKSSCESKYKTRVENEINKDGKNWSDLNKIVKVEERRER
jgi:hypothetical protein